ncbi:MAG: toll/interleukin-1 receptor domain-containing protein [Desulfobacterales bacterium]|nr:toll/interleukin-1 receptor domain-containing protein [Desulfobacterales bacterium]
MKPKISSFISYAREDLNIARQLYEDLRIGGANPWIDFEALHAGQNWKDVIIRAIKKSSHFLPLFSKNSVTKQGFVQKELKTALEVLDEFPTSDIFIIPVRLDESYPSDEKLRDIEWVDLFPFYRVGVNKILRSIVGDEEKYIFDPIKVVFSDNGKVYLAVKLVNNSPGSMFDVTADLYCIIRSDIGYYHSVPTIRQKTAPVIEKKRDYWMWTFDISDMLSVKEREILGTDFINKFIKLISSPEGHSFSSMYFLKDGIDISEHTIFRENIEFLVRITFNDELSGEKKFLRYEVRLNDIIY